MQNLDIIPTCLWSGWKRARFAEVWKSRSFTGWVLRWNCNVQVYFCEEDQVCLYKALAFEVPFSSELTTGQPTQIVPLSYTVKPVQVARGFTKLQWWCGKGGLCILVLCSTLLFRAEIGYFFLLDWWSIWCVTDSDGVKTKCFWYGHWIHQA